MPYPDRSAYPDPFYPVVDSVAWVARLAAGGRVLAGEFRPGGMHREWCESDVLRTLRRRSLARLRHEVEPVETDALGRLATVWQGVLRPRAGLDALLDAIEQRRFYILTHPEWQSMVSDRVDRMLSGENPAMALPGN